MKSKSEEIRQEAEAYAKTLVPNPSKYDAPFYTTADRFNDIEDAYEAGALSQSEDKQQWVSVSERLPEDPGDNYYLVNTTSGGVDIALFMRYTHVIEGDEYYVWENYDNEHVTHWMRLPTPPKS